MSHQPVRSFEALAKTPRSAGRSAGRRALEKYKERTEDLPRSKPLKKLAAYTKIRIWEWIKSYFGYRKGGKPELATWSGGESGVFPLDASVSDSEEDDEIRVSLFADWASATAESIQVADRIRRFDPHFTIHLGDIYYVGSREAAIENLPLWPLGSVGTFALNGNHEMYANGQGYFGHLLPRIGYKPGSQNHVPQQTSFFALENDHWRIIGLDTGYHSTGIPIIEKVFKPSCKLPDVLIDWLERTVFRNGDDGRGTILLSHHQYVSAFEREHAQAGRQLARFLSRPVLWFWGHEHRLAAYGSNSVKDGVTAFGRCIGHGGMPVEKLDETPHGGRKLAFYDNRRYQTLKYKTFGRGCRERELPIGYNGFANLRIDGPRLHVEYRDLNGELLVSERWHVDTTSGDLRGTGARLHPLQEPGEGRYRRIAVDLRNLQR